MPLGKHFSVRDDDLVKAGDPLCDGPVNPHDVLQVQGEHELQSWLVNEIQEVYRLQGVNINDKHIGVIVRQMLRKLEIIDVGDTDFIIGQQIDKFRFKKENERVVGARREPRRRQAGAARHHARRAQHRQLPVGGILPGDHPGFSPTPR